MNHIAGVFIACANKSLFCFFVKYKLLSKQRVGLLVVTHRSLCLGKDIDVCEKWKKKKSFLVKSKDYIFEKLIKKQWL